MKNLMEYASAPNAGKNLKKRKVDFTAIMHSAQVAASAILLGFFNMNTQQKSWLIHLGYLPVPPHLYLDNEQQEVKEIKDTELSDPVRKLNRGILALVRNKNEIPRDEIYKILKDRGFLPVVAGDHFMTLNRFVAYYYKVLKEKGIKREITKSLKQKVSENRHLSIPELCEKFNVSKKSVMEALYRLDRIKK